MRKMGSGFTLMELMIVIAIIMILSGAIVARIGTGSEKAKIAKATAEMGEIASACRAFNLDTGVWPGSNTALLIPVTVGYDETGAPSKPFTAGGNWKGPYLETANTSALPPDPWGVSYGYAINGTIPGGNISVNSSGNFAPGNVLLVHRFQSS